MIYEIPKRLDLNSMREKWLMIGLKSGPVHRPTVRRYLAMAYERGGLVPPKRVYWVASPQEAHRVMLDLKYRKKGEAVSPACYGQHEADWAAFYEAHKALGVTGLDAEGLVGLVKHAGWVWMWEEIAIVCDRPTIYRDMEHRLHNEDQAAVQYDDGYSQYYWHGVSVPAWVILEPEKITAEKILSQPNQEVRRAMLEKATFAVFLDQAEKLDVDEFGALWKLNLDFEAEDIVFVQVKCPSTDREYCLRVPPTTKTATEGVAWTFGLEQSQYSPRVET